MADYTWPTSLPDSLLADGYEEQPPNVVVRTQMDAGPAKVRRRMTDNVTLITGAIAVTKDQLEIFDDFFHSTLSGGASRFNWTHPRTGDAVEMRFREIPTYRRAGGDYWYVEMKLEVMP